MLTAALVFLLLVVVLLAIPLTVTYDVSTRSDYEDVVTIGWAFGLLQFRPPVGDSADVDAKNPESSHGRMQDSSDSGRNGFALVRQKSCRRRLFRFIADLWRAVQKNDIRLNIRIGLGDPADTGQLWALIGPLAVLFDRYNGATISVVPDFFDTTFELDSSGRVRLVPLHIIYLALGLVLSPPVWRGYLATRQTG